MNCQLRVPANLPTHIVSHRGPGEKIDKMHYFVLRYVIRWNHLLINDRVLGYASSIADGGAVCINVVERDMTGKAIERCCPQITPARLRRCRLK